jgi:CRP-like cAMP-binding protein
MGTCLSVPEEDIITQGEDGNDMFFLLKGDCIVILKDESGNSEILDRLMVAGDHFGEISLIYKCKRTSTVVSRNYCQMARLSYMKWRNLVNQFPKYLKFLKQNLFVYLDTKKQFYFEQINQIYFIEMLSKEIKHEIIYSLKP